MVSRLSLIGCSKSFFSVFLVGILRKEKRCWMKEILYHIRGNGNYIAAIVLFGLIIIFYRRKQINQLKSVLLSALSIIAIWINAPLFIDSGVLQNNPASTSKLFLLPYEMSKMPGGIVYLILADVALSGAINALDALLNKRYYTHAEVKKKYDDFVVDAAQLCIIGRDVDFLGKEEYKIQAERIKTLRGNSRLLCEQTDNSTLLELYQDVEKSGVNIRFYQKDESMTNLKGQIKVDQSGNVKALFMSRTGEKYTVVEIEHQFLVKAILGRFNEIYDQATPVPKQ